MGLFDRVFRGSDEMFAKAEADVNALVAELGTSAPVTMPGTAYFLACIYAYTGKKVTNAGELQESLADVKAMMLREYKTKSIFCSGVGTAIAAEMIEACKYARSEAPYEGTVYHGHFLDAEVRELGVPLVTRDIPGFVVMIGPAPSDEEAAETIKGYQSRGIFVFLIGGIIEQAVRMGIGMGFPVRVVPVGEDIWSVGHVISLVVRATMIFGGTEAGDYDAFMDYSMDRIFAFVNAYAPVNDITVACGAGAIKMGFPVITNDTDDMWAVPKSLIINTDTKDWIETSLEARDIKIKVTTIDIPVAFSTAFEGEIIRKADMQVEVDGSRVDCGELVLSKEAHEVEDHAIIVDGPDFDEVPVGSKISLTITAEVYGKTMQTDFEPVMERKIHNFFNCIEGVMHTGQRDMIRVRVSKAAFDAGFRAKHLGEVLYAKLKSEYDTIVDKCQIKICTVAETNKEIRAMANETFNVRDERLESLTDESVEVFYTCILCQAFSPSHV
ncbi:MAG: CO dehydrogenase/CO-methylating acetyl-CoA synthase complex subunit beta, partial [Eubacteriales bacterium]